MCWLEIPTLAGIDQQPGWHLPGVVGHLSISSRFPSWMAWHTKRTTSDIIFCGSRQAILHGRVGNGSEAKWRRVRANFNDWVIVFAYWSGASPVSGSTFQGAHQTFPEAYGGNSWRKSDPQLSTLPSSQSYSPSSHLLAIHGRSHSRILCLSPSGSVFFW